VIGFPEPEEAPFQVLVQELEDRLVIGDLKADFLPLPPAGNHGLRFIYQGKTYALTGDSHFHDQEIDFLRGVDLAIVDTGHLDDSELVELAIRSAPAVLVCSHIYRELDEEALNHEARSRGFSGRILKGRDRMVFSL
jgi:ribonuclease BN (tRNA processing enzyme)